MKVSEFAESKPISFTVDTSATVPTVCRDLVGNHQHQLTSCTTQTVTGNPVKVLGKVDVFVRLDLLEFCLLYASRCV